MLAAEGHIRAGNYAAAATLINVSRERNGLTPIAGITSMTQPISTNLATCVPRVPKAPDFTSTECGNIFEAMKYEKRMESTFTGYMVWFADNRGWGDLIEGTAVEWPVPYQEMQARQSSVLQRHDRAPPRDVRLLMTAGRQASADLPPAPRLLLWPHRSHCSGGCYSYAPLQRQHAAPGRLGIVVNDRVAR